MNSMHDYLERVSDEMSLEMNGLEMRANNGDDIAYIAIQAAGGNLFGDSNIEDFEPAPEGIYPFARPVGSHM